MNTMAWHGEIMGLKGGLKAREITKGNNSTDAPEALSNTMADGDANSNVENATIQEEAPYQAAQEDKGGVQAE